MAGSCSRARKHVYAASRVGAGGANALLGTGKVVFAVVEGAQTGRDHIPGDDNSVSDGL